MCDNCNCKQEKSNEYRNQETEEEATTNPQTAVTRDADSQTAVTRDADSDEAWISGQEENVKYGQYFVAVCYTCPHCGHNVAVNDPRVTKVGILGVGVKLKHNTAECGGWTLLESAGGNLIKNITSTQPPMNRHQRRTAAAMRRTKNGLIVPR